MSIWGIIRGMGDDSFGKIGKIGLETSHKTRKIRTTSRTMSPYSGSFFPINSWMSCHQLLHVGSVCAAVITCGVAVFLPWYATDFNDREEHPLLNVRNEYTFMGRNLQIKVISTGEVQTHQFISWANNNTPNLYGTFICSLIPLVLSFVCLVVSLILIMLLHIPNKFRAILQAKGAR